MSPNDKKYISTGDVPVFGDPHSLRGLQLTSNGNHEIHITQLSRLPWLVFSDQWNVGTAYNCALLSDLTYAEQVSTPNGQIGEVGRDDVISQLFTNLRTTSDITSHSYDGLPLLTRSVRRGDRFQDLRFWDAANICQEGDPDVDPQALAVRNHDQILIAVRGTEPKNRVDGLSDVRFATRAFEEGPPPEESAPEETAMC